MREDLALVWDLWCAVWYRWTCPRDHGTIALEVDAVYVQCARCGFVSPGMVLETHAIRLAWRFDRQRARFPRRKAS